MISFLIPCIAVIVIFWLSVGIVYLMLRSQLYPIMRSMKRLEKQMGTGPNTQEFVTSSQPTPRPRPQAPSRYVTVERGWK